MASVNATQIARVAAGLYDLQLGNASMTWALNAVDSVTYGGDLGALVQQLYNTDFKAGGNAALAASIVAHVGITNDAAAVTYVSNQLTANAGNEGATIVALLNGFAGITSGPYAAAAAAFNTQIAAADRYAQTIGTVDAPVNPAALVAAKTFNLAAGTALGADVMGLTGGQDVIINMTNPANQITGLDLDGDGVIEFDGKERSITGKAANFEIVDAYARNPLNHTDIANNFLGDIEYRGESFAGDGVKTNGGVVLGGLGVDQIFTGVGNDFLAGGGIAQGRAGADLLSGGRNADFFFAHFSPLDRTDGPPSLIIDGGATADDNSAGNNQSAQDADWLLFEGTDDDEVVSIWLNDDNLADQRDGVDGLFDNMGRVLSRSGKSMVIDDVENVDASGNLYGFLNDMDVEIGGRATDSRDAAGNANYGFGASAQLFVSGSNAGNVIIGGWDNDEIEGRGGNDLLMGGNLQQLLETVAGGATNPNFATIVNDGRDVLRGDADNDDIVFEADNGAIDGGVGGSDTLWLTKYSLGTRTTAQMLADGRLRFDLTSENGILEGPANEGGAGYGGANVGTTADQTNYATGVTARVAITNMENIDATGLGAIDYKAAGSNNPELKFANQQNFKGYNGDLQLLGTQGANNLYAGGGNDEIHGRGGNDDMQGGAGNDDFYFALDGHFDVGGAGAGDGVDRIRRKVDANGDDLWDTTSTGAVVWGQDFGLGGSQNAASSTLTITITNNDSSLDVRRVSFFVEGTPFVVESPLAPIGGGTTMGTLVAELQTSLTTQGAAAGYTFKVTTDAAAGAVAGAVFIEVTPPAGTTEPLKFRPAGAAAFDPDSVDVIGGTTNSAIGSTSVEALGPVAVSGDRIIYKAWEDRNDNEGVDDDTVLGSTMSLGRDAYAEDLVISFQADGTRLAEDQSYTITFANLTTQDRVTINVNGVLYTLQVGIDLDGNIVAAEDGVGGDTQVGIQTAFLARLADFITNSFTDDDTVAGKVDAVATATTIVLTQRDYDGEDTVFMRTPTVDTSGQGSGGQAWTATVANNSQHEVLLFNFDGRDNRLNETNVLFWGQEHVQRANLETGKNAGGALAGTDALVIDGRVNDLQANIFNYNKAAVFDNQATNAPVEFLNFTVHGDDFLLGGTGIDQITGGTGDDRIIGSAGSATAPAIGATTGELADGGKNVYAVQVLGESQARVYVLNLWEARNPTLVPDLAGLTISSIVPIRDNETGVGLDNGVGVADRQFRDTLQFEQETFGSSARFTISLDDYVVSNGVVQTRNDGAGLVWVDVNGNGVHDAGVDTYTRFTNFENIRTVSGSGRAVAGDNQGNDTADLTKLSSTTEGAGGVSYNLTNDAGAGEVRYSKDAIITGADLGSAAGDRPNLNRQANNTLLAVEDYEELVIRIDGVESVLTSTGHDLLRIDETEAAKNNLFSAGLGVDRIIYEDDYDGAPTVGLGQPTVTIKVNTGTDTDQVVMKGGRVGTLNTPTGGAVDTLIGVEYVSIAGEVATSVREDDTIDVSAMAGGAVVDYTNGEIRTSVTPGTGVQLVVENMVQMERVIADGNDVVIVADADVMNNNVRSDENNATPNQNILFMTYRDFDDLNANATTRKSFAAQVADDTVTNVINQGQFSFSLSEVGTDADVDRVSYHNELGRIVVPVGQGAWTAPGAATNRAQYVVVDGDQDNVWDDAESRVDALWGVEEIVASLGESAMDFTAVGQGRQITFQYALAANPAENQVVEQTIRIADVNGNVVSGLNAFVERYVYNKTTAAVADATWNRIEGSDAPEVVIYQGSEDLVNQAGLDHRYTTDTLTLRGGNNEVRYSPLETSISATVTVTEENPATTNVAEGLINAVVTFQDGLGVGAPSGVFLGGQHTITSHTSDNSTAVGNLKLEGSQDAEDVVTFAGIQQKTYVLGTSPGVINVNIGALNAMVLTGFEFIQDGATNDIYNFASLIQVTGLTLLDSVGDHDVIKVGNDAAANAFNGGAGTAEIDLADLNVYTNFDFDVLDVSGISLTTLTTLNGVNAGSPAPNADAGADDEVVIGRLGSVATTNVNDFEAVVVSDAAITAHGATFVLNTTANSLVIGTGATAKTLQFNADMNNLSFGGTILAATGVPSATTAVTVTATGPDAVNIRGGAGADSITTAGGNDTIRGGGGNDVIDAGFTAAIGPVYVVTLTGGASALAAAGDNLTLAGATVTAAAAPAAFDPTAAANQIATGADSDQVGAMFASLNLATWVAALQTAGASAAEAGALTGVTYDAVSNQLRFAFNNSAAAATIAITDFQTGQDLAGGTIVATEAFTAAIAAVESNDRYVFEATGAANGSDTINQANNTDKLDFSAFLGANNGGSDVFGPIVFNAGVATTFVADVDFVTIANKGSLAASDFADPAVAGKFDVAEGDSLVMAVTADATGAGGTAGNQPWLVYYVTNGPTAGTGDLTVTLVGTVNSNTELTSADMLTMMTLP